MRGIQERISRTKCHRIVLMSTGSICSPISRLIFTALYGLVHCVKLYRTSDVVLTLRDIGKSEYLGEIVLSATLWPRTQEDKDQVSYVTPNAAPESAVCRVDDVDLHLFTSTYVCYGI